MLALITPTTTGFGGRAVSGLGLLVLIFIAWLFSANRKAVKWRPVIWGVALQIILAVILLAPFLQEFVFAFIDGGVRKLLSFSEAGATFVFQSVEPHAILGPDGNPIAGEDGGLKVFAGVVSPPAKTFAFWILPTIVFFSSLTSVLYHWGILQKVVQVIAWVMARTMGTSGAESLSAAANIFVGQTEAPLLIKPYVKDMTKSELHAVMTGGFATVAGGVMAAYVSFLKDIPGIAGHLVTASILSAPAALAISKVMFPETEESKTAGGTIKVTIEKPSRNVIEAAAQGAAEGVKLAINVAAMLIAFVGIVAMADWALGLVPFLGEPLSMARILGWLFSPIAFIMGVPWAEAPIIGRLLGEKIVLTEFIAYINLGGIIASPDVAISERSAIIASYALCGFANFASIGIQLGGIGGLAPERMGDLAELGLRAMIGGSLAAFMTGTIAGILIG